MSSLVLTGSTSGTVALQAPATAGSNTATIGAATGTHYPFTAGTAVASTSGTSIDFTSIPSWVKRITVMFNGVSTSGTSTTLIQLGDSGGVEATSYTSTGGQIYNTAAATTAYTTGFGFSNANAGIVSNGSISLTNISGNIWICSGVVGSAVAGAATQIVMFVTGTKTLSDTLDRIRITTVNGTDTFDAGSINILYE